MSYARLLLLALVLLAAPGHVGSPDAWYEGSAGPFAVLVHVEVPQVIPGIATVNVKVRAGAGDERVTAVADHADATGGAPPPEVAEPIPDQPGWYRTRLWLMTAGSYSVTVTVAGARGGGSAIVPVAAMPLRRLEFGGPLAVALAGAAAVLLAGLLTIVGAAVRESVLPPGVPPDRTRRRRARWAVARAAVLVGALLLGGWRWWRSEDEAFERGRFRPLETSASVSDGRLVLAIEDPRWTTRHAGAARPGVDRPDAVLVEDHGKLMHLFLVAEDGLAFAHLHPATGDTVRFAAPLPPLPAGRYRAFADIVQRSGFAQTLVASVDLPEPAAATDPADPDDSWVIVPEPAPAHDVAVLADGSRLTWLRGSGPLVAGTEARLRFGVAGPGPDAPPLEPYMGMAGHLAVVRDDGLVFTHVHPMGTISLAAQTHFLEREGRSGPHAMGVPPGDTISFPYAFPEPGRYTIWVQVRRDGRVLTGRFAADVGARAAERRP